LIKAFLAILVSCVLLSSCRKIMIGGCDPGPGKMDTKFDIGVYRGPDMRPEADYISIDGSQKVEIATPEGSANVTCSTPGLLHYSLSLGTHTVTINTTKHTLILSQSGAMLDGTQLAPQSCNNNLSAVIEDI
jgi:hypothetical protein